MVRAAEWPEDRAALAESVRLNYLYTGTFVLRTIMTMVGGGGVYA